MHVITPVLLLATCLLLLFSPSASANFRDSDIVPASRRGQFHGSRTMWHDLLGRHCPRFAVESKVAIPIPQPKGYKVVNQNYKIQFVFDGDRVHSPWIQIIGMKSPAAPIVHIQLEHTGNMLTALKAQVVPVNSEYLREHHQLLREFANATHWPKHLLVHYTWKHNNPINTNAGLYLIFILGLVVTAVLGLSILVSYHEKLDSFLADLAAEEGPSPQELPSRPPHGGSLRQIAEGGPHHGILPSKAD